MLKRVRFSENGHHHSFRMHHRTPKRKQEDDEAATASIKKFDMIGTKAYGSHHTFRICTNYKDMDAIEHDLKDVGDECRDCRMDDLLQLQQEFQATIRAHASYEVCDIPAFQETLQDGGPSGPIKCLHYPLIRALECAHANEYGDAVYKSVWVECLHQLRTTLCHKHLEAMSWISPTKAEDPGGVDTTAYFHHSITPGTTSSSTSGSTTGSETTGASEASDDSETASSQTRTLLGGLCSDLRAMRGIPDCTIYFNNQVVCDFENKKNGDRGMTQLTFYLLGHCFMEKKKRMLGVFSQKNLNVSLCLVKVELPKYIFVTTYESDHPLTGVKGILKAQEVIFDYIRRLK